MFLEGSEHYIERSDRDHTHTHTQHINFDTGYPPLPHPLNREKSFRNSPNSPGALGDGRIAVALRCTTAPSPAYRDTAGLKQRCDLASGRHQRLARPLTSVPSTVIPQHVTQFLHSVVVERGGSRNKVSRKQRHFCLDNCVSRYNNLPAFGEAKASNFIYISKVRKKRKHIPPPLKPYS